MTKVPRHPEAPEPASIDPEGPIPLAPCPFCGGARIELGRCSNPKSGSGEAAKSYWYWCRPCGASGPAFDSPLETAEGWNARKGPVAQ